MFRLFIFILLVGALIQFSFAQQDDIKITRIGVEEGFTQSQVTSIGQDSDGFIWIGTIDGLYRYDGFTFKAFRHNPFDSASLQSNHITEIYGDRHGMVWILTSEGLSLLNPATERIKRFNIVFPLKNTPFYFGDFSEDSAGRVWLNVGSEFYVYEHPHESIHKIEVPLRKRNYSHIPIYSYILESKEHSGDYYASSDSGVFYFRWNTKHFTPMKFDGDEYDTSPRLHEPIVVQDSKGTPIVITRKTLEILNQQTGIPKQYSLPDVFLSRVGTKTSMRAFVDNTDKVWVTEDWGETGIACFDLQTLQWTYTDHFMEQGKRVQISSLGEIHQTKNGDVWIYTKGKGIFRFSQRTATWKKYEHEPSNLHSLSGNITVFFTDKSGNIWVGTDANGLNKIEYQPVKFQLFRNFYDGVRSVQITDTRSLSKDATGALWVGTLVDGVLRLDQSMKIRVRYPYYAVGSIVPDPHDSSSLWFGTWYHGLYKFDTRSSRAIQYRNLPDDSTTLSANVRTMLTDHTGTLWVGTWYSGLNRFVDSSQQFVRYQFDSASQTSLSSNMVYCLYEDRAGILWVGTQHGLNRYNRESESFTRYLHDPNNSQTLRMDDIRSIVEDKSGTLWVGTNGGGLNRFERETGIFSALTTEDGLPNDNIYGILEDRKGNLWLSTNNGLCRYSPSTNEIRNYDVRDGLQNNEFNTGAYCKTASGEMYFGGIQGFNVFHPDSIKDNPFIPPVYITDMKIHEASIPFKANTIRLKHDQNFITVEFIALNYSQPERNQYMIKLDGLDGTWHSIGTRRYSTYVNLSPGEYTFSAMGSNNSRVWNPVAASISFVILPPFWATWWFRGIGILIFLAIGPAIYYIRVSRLKKEQQTQQKFTQQLIENQEQERKRIASDLHDSFGQNMMIIMNHAHISKRKLDTREAAEKELDSILTLSSETLEEMRKIIQNLRPIHLERIGLTKTIVALVERVEQASGLRLHHYVEKIDTLIPKEHEINLYRIIQEMLTNIVKHAQASEAWIEVIIADKKIVVTVRDNGKGFTAQQSHTQTKGTGFGLAGIKERVNILHAEMTTTSSPAEGTEIELRIPIEIGTK